MKNDRISRLVEASVAIQREVWGEVQYNHSLLCQVNLPYRNPGDDVRHYTRTSGGVSLRLEAGTVMTPMGWKQVGLPYGPRARLLMLHLCSLAVKQQSPVVEVEESFTAFCRALGIATNGRNLRTIRDQIRRMSVVSMRLAMTQGKELAVFQGPLFDGIRVELTDDPSQMPMWTNEVRFSPRFYESLKHHAVPLDLRAIQAIRHSARALDIYCWLASRLWRIPAGQKVKVRWTSLKWQFGQPDQSLKSFKKAFHEAFKQARVVYPRARVEFIYGGLQLEQSPPAIERKD
jgi:hypothetical protein